MNEALTWLKWITMYRFLLSAFKFCLRFLKHFCISNDSQHASNMLSFTSIIEIYLHEVVSNICRWKTEKGPGKYETFREEVQTMNPFGFRCFIFPESPTPGVRPWHPQLRPGGVLSSLWQFYRVSWYGISKDFLVSFYKIEIRESNLLPITLPS